MTTTPKTVGRYRVVERIGQGGMGALFLAHDPDIDRLVAIKVLREGLDTGDLRERFRREARAAGRLRHPNIVTIFDVGEYEGQPFIAMEYLPGETLAELIKRKAPLSLRRKLKLLEEVCDGLAYAHKSGIVHRDVKPANLMVEPDGVLKILDFGIVRIAESGMTQAGMLVGTLNYMSPEQVSGAQVDLRSDIFAVGAVGYELLKYEQAFPGTLQDGILYRIMNADPPPIDPALAPPGVYGIILRAIQKDPSKRYRDLGAMRKDLERCRTALPLDEDPADARDDVETEVISTGPLSRGDKPSTGAEKRRAVLIERHLKTAEDALAAGDYRLALSSAEELMILDPAHEAGAQILNEAHAAVLLEEVRAELQRAREQLGRGEVDDAYEVVQRAAARLEDRASSQVEAEFRALREDLERARERQRLIRGALSRASASLQGEAYESAIRASNEILALEPSHPEALRIRADATSAVDRRANAGVAAARARFAGGDHQGAIHLLETAPSHPKVTSALAELRRSAREIAEQREAEEREARLKAERQAQRAEAAAHAVEAALAAGDIDRAESLLGDLRGLASDSSRIPPLVEAIAAARAEAHRRSVRAAVDRLLNDAEERIAAGELDGARSALGRIAELAPNGPAATALRAQLKDRECALAEQKAQAAAALQRSDFRAARAAIAGARAISVSDADVAVLTQDLERAEAASIREAETRRAFEEALSRAQGALGKGELALALEAATAAARLLPADSRAIEIRQRVESARAEAQRRQDQIAAQLKELRRLAKRRDFAAASAAADALLRFDPENAEAQQVREEIAHALAEAEAARLAREQSEAERRRAGEEALALADEAVAAGELDRAGEAVSTAGQNLPGDRRVSELRQRVDSARLEMRRRQDQIEEQLRALRRLAHSGDFAAATAAADALLQFDPGNADAMRILDEIAETRAAAEAARIAHERSEAERRRAGEEALALADGALAAGELDRAGEAVSTAGQHLPGDRRVIELQQRVDSARVEARRRQDQIEEHLRALRRLTHSGDFAAATAAADALLQFDPGNADAERILDEIAETRAAAEAARLARERSEAESRRAFEGELSRAEDALAAGELAAAIEAANAAGQRMPEDPRAIDLQRRVEDAWADARQRQDQIAAQLKELRRLTKKRDFTAATAAVEALLRFDPENAEAQRIRGEIAAEVAAVEAARVAREQRDAQRQREADERRQAKLQRDEEARQRAETERATRAERAEAARRGRQASTGGPAPAGIRPAAGLATPSAFDGALGQLRQLRPPQLLAAAAVVVLLGSLGVWSLLLKGDPPSQTSATPSGPVAEKPQTPDDDPAGGTPAIPTTTIPPVVEPDEMDDPPASPAASEIESPLAGILSRAQQQIQRGQKTNALSSLKAAEKIKPNAPELGTVFSPLVNDARETARKARADADQNPVVPGTPSYAAAARRQRQGEDFLRSGRMAAGIEALWRAGDEFTKLASTPRPTPPEATKPQPDPVEPTRKDPEPPPTPPVNPPKVEPKPESKPDPPKPGTTTPAVETTPAAVDETAAIRAAVIAYQAAWNRMDLTALQRVQPLSSGEAAAVRRTFADARAIELRLEIKSTSVTAPGRAIVVAVVERIFTAKVGGRQPSAPLTTTFTLEKRGNAWVIVDLKV